ETLNFDTLLAHAGQIKAWGSALAADADLLLYGCNVAQQADGQALVDALGRLTGADVAASTNLTGSPALGADWNLEYTTGAIEANIALEQSTQQGWMGELAITSNGTTSAVTSSAGATSLTWSHTVNSGSAQLLVVGLSIENGQQTTGNVTYGGAPMVLVGRSVGSETVEIWQLAAPATGTANIVANFTATTQVVGGATTFSGVNPVTPIRGGFQVASGISTTPSLNVVSQAGDLVVDTLYANDSPATVTVGPGQTVEWTNSTGTGTSRVRGASSAEPGAASVPMTWALSSSVEWRIGAVSLVPSSAGVTVTPTTGVQTTEAGGTAS